MPAGPLSQPQPIQSNLNLQPAPVSVTLPAYDGSQMDYTTNYVQSVLAGAEATRAYAAENCASISAQASVFGSQADYAAATYGAAAQYNAHTYGSDRQLEGTKYSSQVDSIARTGAAQMGATAQVQAAQIEAIARVNAASVEVSSRYGVAQVESTGRLAAAQVEAQAQLGAARIDYDAKVFTASANKDAQVYSAGMDFGAKTYAADQQLAATTLETQTNRDIAAANQAAESARQTERIAFAEDKYEHVYPIVETFLDDNGINTPGMTDAQGVLVPAPYVSLAGVLTERQVQQSVNSALARNDSRTQAAILQAQTELAGRGFSSNSPLLQAMQTGYLGQNLRANCDAETQIRIQAAQANAEQILKATELAVNAFQGQQGVLIESEKNKITRQVGLMGALAQLVGGLS